MNDSNSRWRVESFDTEPSESRSRLLVDRLDIKHHGLYACEAESITSSSLNPLSSSSNNDMNANGINEKLRRLFGLIVNGK